MGIRHAVIEGEIRTAKGDDITSEQIDQVMGGIVDLMEALGLVFGGSLKDYR